MCSTPSLVDLTKCLGLECRPSPNITHPASGLYLGQSNPPYARTITTPPHPSSFSPPPAGPPPPPYPCSPTFNQSKACPAHPALPSRPKKVGPPANLKATVEIMMGLTPTLVRRKQGDLGHARTGAALPDNCRLMVPHAASDVHPHQAGHLQHAKYVSTGEDPGHDIEGLPIEVGQLSVPGLCVNVHQTCPRCLQQRVSMKDMQGRSLTCQQAALIMSSSSIVLMRVHQHPSQLDC